MVSQETMRRVLQEHVDAENAHDRERVLATYVADNPVFDDVPTSSRYVGPEQIVDNYRHLWDGLPNLVRRIDSWAFGDNTCVIELTLSGDHTGPYRGVPGSGRRLDFRIIGHFTFDDDGRIKQETAYYDVLTFMRQLGLGRGQREEASR
jgi:steroid delta-isomerase-like uncharacterized protein